MSLLVISVAFGMIGAGTFSWFTDEEVSVGNTFAAGTIDIAINSIEGNPWCGSFEMTPDGDAKPCQTKYITFDIINVGENPCVLWKHVEITDEDEMFQSENGDPLVNNISDWILYDLSVDGEVVFCEEDGLTLADIACMWMPIGVLAPGDTIEVIQSYHLMPETGNEYQGDFVSFDITIWAEQRLGPGPAQRSSKLFLDDKTMEADWYFNVDPTWGVLDYCEGASIDYNLYAMGLTPSTEYCLIYYPEPQTTWPHPVTVIGTHTSGADGVIIGSGSTDLTFDDGKIWLVACENLNAANEFASWPPSGVALFESNLVDFPYP